jgi:aminoglycoside phosphotransferase (APT) family kinase protein
VTKTCQQSVLTALKSALLAGDDIREADELVAVSQVERRRSTMYFVSVAARPGAARWVVKQPSTATQQHDLGSPLTAQAQYAALVALHDELDDQDARFAAPRPIALLADAGAFAMEFVDGRSIPELLDARAVLRPRPLLDAVRSAAALLRVLHAIQPQPNSLVDHDDPADDAVGDSRHVLERMGLPVRSSWFDSLPRPQHTQTSVLLHGDFAPENVVITSGATYCLDPALTKRGARELDVVRFLTMLCDAPLFIHTLAPGPVGRLRRRLAAEFVETYYCGAARPTSLQPMLVHAVALRWAQRHDHIFERDARAPAAWTMLLRAYFSRLLTEVSSSPQWP